MDYTKYLMKFGEHGVQAILEDIEKREHICYNGVLSLEQRWEIIMSNSDSAA
ncbi:MAG: hypothetical protein FWF23_02310 [Alphaproteobacteria bacterium]|nr:hypothetical protein [Alphaproteobacteria bacterium]MCL2505855.1 hypothetical protein [Alphaproteobacteria bacterium]